MDRTKSWAVRQMILVTTRNVRSYLKTTTTTDHFSFSSWGTHPMSALWFMIYCLAQKYKSQSPFNQPFMGCLLCGPLLPPRTIISLKYHRIHITCSSPIFCGPVDELRMESKHQLSVYLICICLNYIWCIFGPFLMRFQPDLSLVRSQALGRQWLEILSHRRGNW